MATFKVFVLKNTNGVYQLNFTGEQFDTHEKAKAFVMIANKHSFGGR